MHKTPTACPLRWELECRKNSSPTNGHYQIASMRRNNGDAVSQHGGETIKAFVKWRAAMHVFLKSQAKRTDQVASMFRDSGGAARVFKARTAVCANEASGAKTLRRAEQARRCRPRHLP